MSYCRTWRLFRVYQVCLALSVKRRLCTALPNRPKAMEHLLPRVWVRCVPHEEIIKARFTFKLASGENRVFNMCRSVYEPVSMTLSRLANNLLKHSSDSTQKKRNKRQSITDEDVDSNSMVKQYQVILRDQRGDVVNGDLHNCHAWAQGSTLHVNEAVYIVEVNPPTVLEMNFPRIMLSGYTVYPMMSTEFTDVSSCEFQWYSVGIDSNEPSVTLVSTEQLYIPTADVIGKRLQLKCTPRYGGRFGESVEVTSSTVVIEGPMYCPFEERHKLTSNISQSNSFRIITYNILAEVYTDSDYSRDELFGYCPAAALQYEYRRQLILKELLGYNADIICLQEVDRKHFVGYFQPILKHYGFESSMLIKRHKRVPAGPEFSGPLQQHQHRDSDSFNDTPPDSKGSSSDADTSESPDIVTIFEGSAIFYRSSKFRQIAHYNLNISETIEDHPLYEDLFKMVQLSQTVKEKILYRSGTSLQVVVLESVEDPRKRVCVATTHLYFHPEANVVRIIQTAASLRFLQYVKSIYSGKDHNLAVVFTGDFNSTPDRPAIELVLTGQLNATNQAWSENPEYQLKGIDLHHHLGLESACGFPPHTNFVPLFKACIDYIFYSKDTLEVESVVPVPSAEVLAQHNGGIPSVVFPSDHLALVCDLAWRNHSSIS